MEYVVCLNSFIHPTLNYIYIYIHVYIKCVVVDRYERRCIYLHVTHFLSTIRGSHRVQINGYCSANRLDINCRPSSRWYRLLFCVLNQSAFVVVSIVSRSTTWMLGIDLEETIYSYSCCRKEDFCGLIIMHLIILVQHCTLCYEWWLCMQPYIRLRLCFTNLMNIICVWIIEPQNDF